MSAPATHEGVVREAPGASKPKRPVLNRVPAPSPSGFSRGRQGRAFSGSSNMSGSGTGIWGRGPRSRSIFEQGFEALGGQMVKNFVDERLAANGLSDRMQAARAKVERRRARDASNKDVLQWDLPFQSSCLFIIAIYALYNVLIFFRDVFVPFVVAIFLMYLLDPLVRLLVKPRDIPDMCLRLLDCLRCREHERDLEWREEYNIDWDALDAEGVEQAADPSPVHGDNDDDQMSAPLLGSKDTDKKLTRATLVKHNARIQDSSHTSQGNRSRLDSLDDDDMPLSPRDRDDDENSWYEDPNWPLYRRVHCPRCFAVIIALAVAVGFLFLVGLLISDQVNNLENHLDIYQKGLTNLETWLDKELKSFGVNTTISIEQEVTDYAKSLTPTLLSYVESIVENGVVTIIFLIYLLTSPLATGTNKKSMAYDTDKSVRTYIKLKSFICFLVGAGVGVCYYLLKVDLAWVFGLLTMILNFIPNVGGVIAMALPTPIVLLDTRMSVAHKVMAFVIPLCVHQIVGNYIEPKVFGENLDLHPIIVLLSLTGWSAIWGIAGAILCVPIMAVLRVACMHIDHPYARKMLVVLEGNVFESARIKKPKKRRKTSKSLSSTVLSANDEQENAAAGDLRKRVTVSDNTPSDTTAIAVAPSASAEDAGEGMHTHEHKSD